MRPVNLKTVLGQVSMQSLSSNEVAYECPECGRVVEPVKLEVFGKARTIRGTCPCVLSRLEAEEKARKEREEAERMEKLWALADLGPRFRSCTWESWIKRRGSENSYSSAKTYADNFETYKETGEGLLFFGDPGSGKTHLASAIVTQLVAKGYTCVFRSVPAILKRLQESYKPNSKLDEVELLTALRQADLLVLDDLGAEHLTSWTESTLYYVVDERYRWKRPVIVTTNCNLEDLETRVSSRTFDRLLEMCALVENKATSYRKARALKKKNGGRQPE